MTPVGPRLTLVLRVCIFLCAVCSSIASFSQDLVITEITGSKSITQYSSFSVSVTVKNDGIVSDYKSTWVELYLSTDNAAGTDYNEYVGSIIIPILAANESKNVIRSFSTNFLPGNYYLIAKVDPSNGIDETDESNNTVITSGYTITEPDIDFTITSLVSDKPSQVVHQSVKIDFAVANSGTTNVEGYLATMFYLSADNVIDNNDTKIFSIDVSLSDKADIASGSRSFTIPAITPGNYFIIGQTDVPSKYIETNESNNIFFIPLTIDPSDIDLEVVLGVQQLIPDPYDYPPYDTIKYPFAKWSLFQDISMGGGTSTNIGIEIILKNNGTTGFNDYSYALYLSKDTILDASEEETSFYTDLSKSMTATGKDSVKVFLNNAPNPYQFYNEGEYYIIVKLNPDHSMAETDYSNNIGVSKNKIKIAYPKILITNASVAGTYTDQDTDFNLSLSFKTH
jgi:hypothetical protein